MNKFYLICIIMFSLHVEANPILDILPGKTCQEAHELETSLEYTEYTLNAEQTAQRSFVEEGHHWVKRKINDFESSSSLQCIDGLLISYNFEIHTPTPINANKFSKAWWKIIESRYGKADYNSYIISQTDSDFEMNKGEASITWKLVPSRTSLSIDVVKYDKGFTATYTWSIPKLATIKSVIRLFDIIDVEKTTIEAFNQNVLPMLK